MKICCGPLNKHMENFGQAVLSLAAFATTIDWLWKDRQPKGRAFIRITVAGALFFKSGIGWMSDAIASICTSRETRNLPGRRSISPRRIVQCFGVSCSAFWKRQDSSTFDGCRHLTAVSINQYLLRTVTVEIRRLHSLTLRARGRAPGQNRRLGGREGGRQFFPESTTPAIR